MVQSLKTDRSDLVFVFYRMFQYSKRRGFAVLARFVYRKITFVVYQLFYLRYLAAYIDHVIFDGYAIPRYVESFHIQSLPHIIIRIILSVYIIQYLSAKVKVLSQKSHNNPEYLYAVYFDIFGSLFFARVISEIEY